MAGIATIRGTAIVPGVSRNGRLYTREILAAAVEQAQERIAAGRIPMTMLTHHGAEDDSTRIVGRLTALEQRDDGSVAFTAELADTQHGRDIAALVTGDEPFLDGVSIRGWWNGPVRTVNHEGQRVETGDSLTLDGLDFTKTPGVPGARIEGSGGRAKESSDGRHLVYESVTEASAKQVRKPYGDVKYADPGYRDGVKRYPIDTKAHAKSAWSYINQAKNARQYSAAQLKRIKARIKAALKGFGVDVTAESTTTLGEITEFYADGPGGGGFCIDAYNGPVSLTIRACGIDPAELRVIASAAMDAACDALQALDPDMDADIDVAGAPHADTDGDMAEVDDDAMETAQLAVSVDGKRLVEVMQSQMLRGTPTLTETTPAAPVGEHPDTQEVPAVSEPITPAAETATPAQIVLTQEQFGALLDRIGAPAAAAPAEETAPAAPVVESDEERIARLVTAGLATAVESIKDDLRKEMQESGPRRVGVVVQTKTAESDMPTDRPLHELPQAQRDQLEKDALLRHFGFAK